MTYEIYSDAGAQSDQWSGECREKQNHSNHHDELEDDREDRDIDHRIDREILEEHHEGQGNGLDAYEEEYDCKESEKFADQKLISLNRLGKYEIDRTTL